ncbi:MAG: hypothetical protein M1834_007899 [Cirrosporium novae-zelandiae]|nr:MAG: hypothetical protein M1834_007899 [Cirrosporium novae-zelandiae]
MASIESIRDVCLNEIQPSSQSSIGSQQDDYEVQPGEYESESNPSRSRLRVTAIITALFLSLFLAALDETIVSTALPTICSQFHSASGYTWIGSAYLLGNAAASPIWAKFSDIWGRKPILLAIVGFFFLSSIVCAVSKSMAMLITGRALQGVAGGGIIPLVHICISDLFSMRSRGLWFGLLQFVWALAGGMGPILGGVFTQMVSWRWIFYINLPFSGITFIILLIFLDVHNPKTKISDGLKAVDWFGGVAILGLTLMLLLGLDFGGETFPWNSPRIICLLVFGALMSLFFVFSEARLAEYPLIPLDILRRRSNVATLVLAFCHGMAIIAIFVGIFIHRTGRYVELIYIGSAVLTLGCGLFILFNVNSSLGELIGIQIVSGLGAGLLFDPPLIALQAFVPPSDTATATSTFSFVRTLALALAVVIGGVVFQNGMKTQGPKLRAAGLSASLTEKLSGASAAANISIIKSLKNAAQKDAVKQAFAWSLRNIWIVFAAVAACGLASSFFIEKQELTKHHVETKTGLVKKEETPSN